MQTSRSFTGGTALITGGAAGVSLATAKRLVAAGMNVAIVDRDGDLAHEHAQEFPTGRALGLGADVTDPESLDEAIAATVERFGTIDICVANAGCAPPAETAFSAPQLAFWRTVDANLYGIWRTAQAVLPHVIASSGFILMVSPVPETSNRLLDMAHAITRGGVEQLVRALRVELAPHGASAGLVYMPETTATNAADTIADAITRAHDVGLAYA